MGVGVSCIVHFVKDVYQFSSVQLLSRVRLFVTPWIAARQAFLSIRNSRTLPRLMSIESVMPSSHLIFCCLILLLPRIPPSIGSFPMSQLFAWGGQSIGVSASASILPMNTQDWSPYVAVIVQVQVPRVNKENNSLKYFSYCIMVNQYYFFTASGIIGKNMYIHLSCIIIINSVNWSVVNMF